MRVFIITEGGRNIGFGHITRCISLYQAFERRKIIPELIVNGDNTIEELLKDIGYHQQQLVEEAARVEGRNKWKQKLVESIGLPPQS